MSGNSKSQTKQRRTTRVRSKIFGTNKRPRLSVFRSNKHVYVQLVNDGEGKTLISLGDMNLSKTMMKDKTKVEIAGLLGEEIAKKAKLKKISSIVFDRGGYKYHGRVKAVAEGARKGGLKF